MAGTQKISPKELSRIYLASYRDAENVDDFISLVGSRSGIIMLRYFVAAIYYLIDMLIGEGE